MRLASVGLWFCITHNIPPQANLFNLYPVFSGEFHTIECLQLNLTSGEVELQDSNGTETP
jgi:hypothetical protein